MDIIQWKKIIDKISPFCKRVTLTGGEFFLFNKCTDIVKYIRLRIPKAYIICISNAMHDFRKSGFQDFFKYIDAISFSCDSIEREGLRKRFVPKLFVSNVEWVRNNFPNLSVSISSVLTKYNSDDIKKTSAFCKAVNCSFEENILIPESLEDINDMPSIEKQDEMMQVGTDGVVLKKIGAPRLRCGAGTSICSIDPYGNAYPCQSLHYPEFLMGNLLDDEVEDLKYVRNREKCIPSVDDVPVCSSCKVKYICGGGCLATIYNLNGKKLGRNHFTCHLNLVNSIEKLKKLDNRL